MGSEDDISGIFCPFVKGITTFLCQGDGHGYGNVSELIKEEIADHLINHINEKCKTMQVKIGKIAQPVFEEISDTLELTSTESPVSRKRSLQDTMFGTGTAGKRRRKSKSPTEQVMPAADADSHKKDVIENPLPGFR